jgi:hypothetical protein
MGAASAVVRVFVVGEVGSGNKVHPLPFTLLPPANYLGVLRT